MMWQYMSFYAPLVAIAVLAFALTGELPLYARIAISFAGIVVSIPLISACIWYFVADN